MVYINRLKNGVGKEDEFYIPKNAKKIICTKEFMLSDNEISQSVKNRGIKLVYYPNVYTLKKDDKTQKLVLKDISEQNVELPTTLAMLKPQKTIPEIIFNGYMLCIDKNLENN